jgi:integrase
VVRETVKAFLDKWLETYAATNTTLRTRVGYQGYIQRYIIPSIGHVELQKLTPRQIQNVYAGMLEKGLSNTTVAQLHRILHKAFATAVKWGLLARNPVDATTAPRLERKQMDMWDLDTIDRFLEVACESRFCELYQLAILTGLRWSELCGLKWENVDLVAHRLSLVETLQRIKGYGLVEGRPKTARSRRSIALSPQAVDVLHANRGRQIEQQLEAGSLWQNTGYVFTKADGSPVAPDMISKDFCALVRKAGLPHLTFHGLRHAHATLFLVAGVNPKVVSERLGHSNIAITMDIYSHVIPGLQEEAALLLDQRLVIKRPPSE